MATYDPERALELLRRGSHNDVALFREGQEDAIRHVVNGEGRLLVVQKTGWGKSFVYFIATKLLREQGAGPTLLISPLLSLMRNQIRAATAMGLRAATINSANEADWIHVEQQVVNGEVDLLLISPERLSNERFRETVLASVGNRIGLLVIDEAHCISDWGHDFRPDYRMVERIIRLLPSNLRLLATTATANERVRADLEDVLGPNLRVDVGNLVRGSLTLQTLRMPPQANRLAWIAERLSELDGSGIIYTLTVRDAEQVAAWLRHKGFAVEAYSSDSGDNRESLEDDLLRNRVKALAATTALGMGFDKPDLSFVIHYQTPGSVVAYYQQVGRAGRAISDAYGVLLSGEEEEDINDWFIQSAVPTREEVSEVLTALEEAADGLGLYGILERVNISMSRVRQVLKLTTLESPAPIVKEGNRYQLTAARMSESFWERAQRIAELRVSEKQQMQEYVDLGFGMHMPFLIDALDGDSSNVPPPKLPELSGEISRESALEAEEFLKRTDIPIEPKQKWPTGGLERFQLSGAIAPDLRPEVGRALCFYGDYGWGSLVRMGKNRDGTFSDELVSAVLTMLDRWAPYPRPQWVTAVPSLRHPILVPDFARRLAHALNLPFTSAIAKTEERPAQKTMQNSVHQARNLDGALAITSPPISPGPVLLVDDVVDSGWTMTLTSWLLRDAGSGPVLPVALAKMGS